MVVVSERWMLEIFSLVVVVIVGRTFCMVIMVVVVMMMMRIRIQSLSTRLLLPGQLSKAMSNRAQNLHLSGVLLPY